MLTPANCKVLESSYLLARSTGQSFTDVAEAATELARQGLNVSETLQRTSDALILTRLSGMKEQIRMSPLL